MFDFLVPEAPIGAGASVLSTLRRGGVSRAPYGAAIGTDGGFNLGLHCGDDPRSVIANRRALQQHLPGPPQWLNQVHGSNVAVIEQAPIDSGQAPGPLPAVDAAVTRHQGLVLAVLTADCLPVVIADCKGRALGVAHAGWRGLAAGVVEATLDAVLKLSGGVPADCQVWLGPAIGPMHFEVGLDVRRAFCDTDPAAASAFRPSAESGKWFADLPGLARRRLLGAGVTCIQGGHWCTVADPQRFFSYRRDRVTGRMATLAWLT